SDWAAIFFALMLPENDVQSVPSEPVSLTALISPHFGQTTLTLVPVLVPFTLPCRGPPLEAPHEPMETFLFCAMVNALMDMPPSGMAAGPARRPARGGGALASGTPARPPVTQNATVRIVTVPRSMLPPTSWMGGSSGAEDPPSSGWHRIARVA